MTIDEKKLPILRVTPNCKYETADPPFLFGNACILWQKRYNTSRDHRSDAIRQPGFLRMDKQ